MKYLVAIALLLACGAAGLTSCRSTVQPKIDGPMVGGYGESRPVDEESLTLWQQASASDERLRDLTPVTVATQVVAGLNYKFTCKDKNGRQHTVTIFRSLNEQEKPRVTNVFAY